MFGVGVAMEESFHAFVTGFLKKLKKLFVVICMCGSSFLVAIS
jgi:hypothetical protein